MLSPDDADLAVPKRRKYEDVAATHEKRFARELGVVCACHGEPIRRTRYRTNRALRHPETF